MAISLLSATSLAPQSSDWRTQLSRKLVHRLDPSLSACDHSHICLGLGKQANELQISVDGRLRSYLDWILSGGAIANDARGGWLVAKDGKTISRIALNSRWTNGEAHPGQILWYLFSAELIDAATRLRIGGGSTTPAAMTMNLLSVATKEGDNDYLLLDGIHLLESTDLEAIVAGEIEKQPNDSPCWGIHRLTALLHVVRHGRSRVRATTFEQAGLVVRQAIVDIVACQLPNGSFALPNVAPASRDERVALQSHILEFLIDAEGDHPIAPEVLRKGMGWLQSELPNAWSVRTLGHAAHAVSLFSDRRSREPYASARCPRHP